MPTAVLARPRRLPGAPPLAARLRQALVVLQAAAAQVDGADAAALGELMRLFSTAEKVAGAATLRCARRLGDDGARAQMGARDRAALVSSLCGSSLSRARAGLEVAEQAEAAPAVRDAMVRGDLSLAQAAVIAPAAAAVPGSAGELVAAAAQASLTELRRMAARRRRAAEGEQALLAREAAVVGRRHVRCSHPATGGVRIEALLPTAEGARLLAALDKETDALFFEAWAAGAHEPRERLMADALCALVAGTSRTEGAHVVVHVDAAALRRGAVDGGEQCEIAGVGEVPVATAAALMGDGLLSVVVRDGVDIRTVTSTTRTVPQRVRVALLARDPTCVVPGCGATRHLEIDHWRTDYARHGPTELDNLCRLCPAHHRLKTTGGWRLAGGPGRWRWLPPG